MRTDQSPPAFESTTLLLSIGGVVGEVVLVHASSEFVEDLQRRYAGFTLPNAPGVARAFSLAVSFSNDARLGGAWPAGVIQPEVRTSAASIEVRRWDFVAQLNDGGNGCFHGTARCYAQPWPLESLLRVLWSVLLPRAGGGLFHACGVRDGDRGVLAAGPSGAGKTTLARKVKNGDDVLSDEVVAVHRGAEGRFRVSGTPFFGELQRGVGTLQSWPLVGVAFLQKAETVQVTRLPTAQAVLRTLECLMCFESDPETVQRNFALVIALCQEVPTFVSTSSLETPIDDVLQAWQPYYDRRKTLRPPSASPRELIASLRTSIERHGTFAFAPRGSSMRPWMRSGDALFVEAVQDRDISPGDVVLYWRAGRSAENDTLICHRVLGRRTTPRGSRIYAKGDSLPHIEAFDDGQDAQVIGRVKAISRAGRSWPVPGRLASMAILLTSLLLIPFYKLRSPG